MRRLVTTLVAIILCIGAFAQTSLKGVITDEGNGSAIVGATVTLGNQNISTTTNGSGEFALIYLEAIDEEVVIEADGYLPAVKIINLKENQSNDLGEVSLKSDIAKEMQDEVIVQLTDLELSDDEGKSQTTSAGSNASNDVFNSGTSYAWSTVRYRGRGLEQTYEQTYINGVNFNTQERGTFSYAMIGGLNDASRNKDVVNGMEASNFTFGSLGTSTNIMMDATRYAQGFKFGFSATNRNYKGRAYLTYASGLLESGWAFVGSIAWRYSPKTLDAMGNIGEGVGYNSLGYFFSAEKQWGKEHKLSITTFGSPTERGQSAGVTQEVYNLTNQWNYAKYHCTWGYNSYNPYWGYQNGKVRNSRIVKSFDPTLIASYDWKISDNQVLKAALGYHYSLYSNSALTFYNAPDPRPDYYRNLPSFLTDGQINNQGNFISKTYSGAQGSGKWDGTSLGSGHTYNGTYIGPSVDLATYSTLTDLWTSRDVDATQINWDNLYAANYASNANDPDGSARYMLERRHNDIQEAMANINYQNSEYDNLKITAGFEAKYSQGLHYKTVDDLLGGNQWIDVDPFAERDLKELASNIGLTQEDIKMVKQNDIENQDRVVKDGDRFGYNYNINMFKASAWAQNEWSFNSVDFYYALKLTYSQMSRTSTMLNGRAWYLAQLKPDESFYYLGMDYQDITNEIYSGKYRGWSHKFIDPGIKLGATYKIDGRNRLKVNAMAETSAPLARDAYLSPRVHDRAIDVIYTHDRAQNLKDYYAASQKNVGADLTYEFNFPIVRGRITGYYNQIWNGSELNGYYDDEARTFVNQAITGINRRHLGLEAAAAFKIGTMFTITPMLAVADHRYTSNAYSVTSAENGMALAETKNATLYELKDSVLINGLRVASGPQVNASVKISFFHSKMWFADVTISYFDWNFLDYAPSRRMQGLFTGVRADGTAVNGQYTMEKDENGDLVYDKYGTPVVAYPHSVLSNQESLVASKIWDRFLIDASVGKLIYLKNRQSLSLNLSVSNLTNNVNMKTGGYQQSRLPRSTVQKTTHPEKSVITNNVWKFPAKYYYAWGANFYFNLTYKF